MDKWWRWMIFLKLFGFSFQLQGIVTEMFHLEAILLECLIVECLKFVDGQFVELVEVLVGFKVTLLTQFSISELGSPCPAIPAASFALEATKRIIVRMIANGARHISLVSANPQQFTIKERRKGYEQALRAAGLPVDESLIVEVPFETYRQEVFSALDRVFQSDSQVDGFFFTSHIMALEAFRYFYEHGININDGFQLGCFHGIPAFKAFAPTMHVSWMPEELMGKTAVQLLHEQIECKKNNQQFVSKHVVLNCN